jgi:uncharacterized membrane protein YgcG
MYLFIYIYISDADGIVGEVLFWALRLVVGTEAYTDQLHSAWVKVYSRMLRVIVPVAISWELERGSSKVQSTRVSNSRSRAVDSGYVSTSAQLPDQKRILATHLRNGGGSGGGGGGVVTVGDENDDDNGKERIAQAEPAKKGPIA